MSTLINIPGTKLYRDPSNMALINRDSNGMEEYYNRRKALLAQREEINSIKQEMKDIKNLILQLLGNNPDG